MLLFGAFRASVVLACTSICLTVGGDTVTLAISHINDLNGQTIGFKPHTFSWSNWPSQCYGTRNCVGGFTNVVHWLFENKTFFDDLPIPANNIRVSAGNFVSLGSDFQILLAQNDGLNFTAKHMWDYMQFTSMALGSKEFELGLYRLTEWTSGLPNHTILLANTCQNQYNGTENTFCSKVRPFKRLELVTDDRQNAYTVGIVGFTSLTVQALFSPGQLVFTDPATTLHDVTSRVEDIKSFIAIGEGNLETAKQILEKCPKVKLVILSNGLPGGTEFPENKYPMQYKQGYIVTAGAYGSSVGKLQMRVNIQSHVVTIIQSKLQITTTPVKYNANSQIPVYHEPFLYDAESMDQRLQRYKKEVVSRKVALTRIDLQGGDACWQKECSLGNLVTNAVAYCVEHIVPNIFPHPIHVIWHSGALTNHRVNSGRYISEYDVRKFIPGRDFFEVVKILGAELWRLFEISSIVVGRNYTEVADWRSFLQVSRSMKVEYEVAGNTPKVYRIQLVHNVNGTAEFLDADTRLYYYIAIPTFLYEGRGSYKFRRTIWTDVTFSGGTSFGICTVPRKIFGDPVLTMNMCTDLVIDAWCLEIYLEWLKTVAVGIEERISVKSERTQETTSCSFGIMISILGTVAVSILVLVIIYKMHLFEFSSRLLRVPKGAWYQL